MPQCLPPGQKPLALVTHDESAFGTSDGKRRPWMEDGNQSLRPKARGKSLMVSDLTPGRRLPVPDAIRMLNWLYDWYATEYFESGKDKYWRGDGTVDHAAGVAVPIFDAAFTGCQAVSAFDNASDHCSYAVDALRVNMSLRPGGKQGVLREGFMYGKGLRSRCHDP